MNRYEEALEKANEQIGRALYISECSRNPGLRKIYDNQLKWLGTVFDLARIGLTTLRAQQERENPEPLTLDKLREMDGEPVYVHSDIFSDDCGWRVIKTVNVLDIQFTNGDWLHFSDYDKSWIAYRHKPEEGTI